MATSGDGNADITIPVYGSLGRGVLEEWAQEGAGKWRLCSLVFHSGKHNSITITLVTTLPLDAIVNEHHFWVNPFGMHFGHIRVSDLVLVNEHGVVVEGNRPVNEAAFAIHSRLHMARPDVVAAAHAHSLYGKTWSSLGRLLDPLTQDACAFYEDHSLFDDYTGVVYDISEGDRIAEALGHRKAIILQNHGILTVGRTVDEAAWFFITMDRSCQAQLMAEAAGKPRSISRTRARWWRKSKLAIPVWAGSSTSRCGT